MLETESSDSCAVSSRSMCPRSASAKSSTCASRNDAADEKSGASASAERTAATVRSPTSVGPINPSRSRVLLLKPTSQLRILALHALELRHLARSKLTRTRHRCCNADSLRVLQVRIDRGHDHAGLDGHQIDSDERDAYPCVDDDALVQNTVENIDE